MQGRLVAGLERMHDDSARAEFLLELGGQLDAVTAWLKASRLDDQVNADYAPTFLHGGSSANKWLVMGINPGADDEPKEHQFKRSAPENFRAFHERFFTQFPKLRSNGKQPWWSKLYRVTRVLDGVVAGRGDVPWRELQRSSNFVVQDLIPFHGRRSGTLNLKCAQFTALVNATIDGVARSRARGVLVFSRDGFARFSESSRTLITRRFQLVGETTTGMPRTIAGYVARLGELPLVALDNEFISQPTFPYEAALPQLLEQLREDALVD